DDDLIEEVDSLFSSGKNEFSVELAYLFGSHATGTDGPISDYDIAVLFAEMVPVKKTYGLAYKLAALFMTERVDIVVLNCAPIELKYAVVETGTVIYEVAPAIRVEFEASTLSCYGDFLPYLRRQKKEILEERNNEAGIQRYRKTLRETERLLTEIRTV
ncbi:MAG: nucleotidyltransferase domain-containing protein, partial [Desulfobacterales bacterium]